MEVKRHNGGRRMIRVAEHLSNLIRIPSLSSISNRPLTAYARKALEAQGWTIREELYVDNSGTEKVNLIAAPPGQDVAARDVELAFLCHTDTVPHAQDWLHALDPRLRGDMLHGCGACDVKGFLACLLTAAESKPARWAEGLRIVLTADEEIGCIGSKQLIASGSLRPQRLIVGEPTSLHAARAGKGYCLARVTFHGREAHSALPQQGVSAIYGAARFVSAIEEFAQQLAAEKHDLFEPAFTTINVGTMQGGSAKNIIPGLATLLVEWRPVPGLPPQQVPAAMQTILQKLERCYPGLRSTLEVLREDPGFETPADAPLVRYLENATGKLATSIPFGSEATAWAAIVREVVVLGPGDMSTAHSDRECVSVQELIRAVQITSSLMHSGPASKG